MEECRERTIQLYLHQIHRETQEPSATASMVATADTIATASMAATASRVSASAGQPSGQTDLLLLTALKDYRQRTGIGLAESDAVSVVRTELGRPYFISGEKTPCSTQCSVSHSGRYWICGLSEFRLGIDLEDPDHSRRHNGERIAQRFFSTEEAEYVRRGGSAAFYQLWVRKEALLKYRGTGLSELGDCPVFPPESLWISDFNPKPGVFAAVCTAVPLKWKEIVEL